MGRAHLASCLGFLFPPSHAGDGRALSSASMQEPPSHRPSAIEDSFSVTCFGRRASSPPNFRANPEAIRPKSLTSNDKRDAEMQLRASKVEFKALEV